MFVVVQDLPDHQLKTTVIQVDTHMRIYTLTCVLICMVHLHNGVFVCTFNIVKCTAGVSDAEMMSSLTVAQKILVTKASKI